MLQGLLNIAKLINKEFSSNRIIGLGHMSMWVEIRKRKLIEKTNNRPRL